MRTDQPTDKPFLPDPSAIEISDEKYNELRELSIEMVQDTIIGKTDVMAPVLFVHYRKFQEGGMMGDLEHAIVLIADGFGDSEQKRRVLFGVGKRFEEEQMIPAAVFMGSEAWTSDKPKDGIMPSQDPDRKECIIIAGRSIGGECKSLTILPIGHDDKGLIIREGEEFKYPAEIIMESPLLDQFFVGFFSDAQERKDNDNNDNDRRR